MAGETQRYRRKPAEYEVAARLFNDAGEPVVRLNAGDFDAIEVPWDEFKGDFEPVPAEEAATEEAEFDEGQEDPAFTASVVEGLTACLASFRGEVAIKRDAAPTFWIAADRFRTILDAARKSLAEPADRCRAGEYLPACYLKLGAGYEHSLCYSDKGGPFIGVRTEYAGGRGSASGGFLASEWDAARARWIADGRPSS